jgi:phosphopantetheinyl transferase (holo-ACP synthase)
LPTSPGPRVSERPGVRVGNDVVDLSRVAHRARGEERERRFLARVFAPEERHRIAAAAAGDRILATWAGWAAKETAFKVHSKLLGSPPVFHHARYVTEVELGPTDGGLRSISGRVRGPGLEVRLSGWGSEAFVHLAGAGVLGTLPDAPGWILELGVERRREAPPAEVSAAGDPEEFFTPLEQEGIRGPDGARVRALARRRIRAHLARLRRPVSTVEIRTDPGLPGRSPPRVWIDGVPSGTLDVSLSHHGSCVAWALLLPEGAQATGKGPVSEGDDT